MPEPPRDPMRAAQANMRPPALRRFYKSAEVVATEGGGYALKLDGRGARTPGKRPLVAPTRAVAELIAAEWAAQGETIEPMSMPATRLANSAIDGVADALAETHVAIAGYAGADLLCYRAEAPEALVAAEAEASDPVLDWAGQALGAKFLVGQGVAHVRQPENALQAVDAALRSVENPFALAALHVMTSLTGSVVLALAVARGRLGAGEAWRIAHVGEDFQTARWGEDVEAAARRAARWRDFEAAARTLAGI